MIKPSKVVFISDELEKDFNSLKQDDPIKKAIMRAIQDLKENAFSGIQIPKRFFPRESIQNMGLITYGNTIFLAVGGCCTLLPPQMKLNLFQQF